MKKFPYTWKQIFTTPKLLKFYSWQVAKIWFIFFVLGAMLGATDLIGLAWHIALFSIAAVLLLIVQAKYCPDYFIFHNKEN